MSRRATALLSTCLALASMFSLESRAGDAERLISSARQTLSDASSYTRASALPRSGTLADTRLTYTVKGTAVYLTAQGAEGSVLAAQGEYAVGEGRYILVGEDGQVLNANLRPVQSADRISLVSKRPGPIDIAR